jgi:cyclopropane fatty-acyl-phospholipid synthase-like methyltransferase
MDKTQIAIQIFNKLATEYQRKFMDVSMYGKSFDFFCNTIKKENPELLEIACGPGNITKYLLNKRPDFKLLGIDLAPNMIELAKLNNPTARFQLMDGRDIHLIQKKYDAIVCGFCLPYFSKEEAIQFIENASQLLNTKGILYISTMEDAYSKSGFKKGSTGEEIFMHYHQADYLTDALTNNKFTVLKLERIEYVNADETKTIDLIIIAEKQEGINFI